MLVKEVDSAFVYSPGNGFSDLMGGAALNHVQFRPSILGLGAGGRTDEEGIPQLSLQFIFLDVAGQVHGHLSNETLLTLVPFWDEDTEKAEHHL